MAKKSNEPKIVLEREYIVPLRRGWLKVSEFKRANKAVKTLKEFLVRHMKVYDRDLKKIKVDLILNNEIRFRGMRNPPAKIKVKALKFDDGIVKALLVDIPEVIKFKMAREKKKKEEVKEKIDEIKKETKKTEGVEDAGLEGSEEKKEEVKEKEESAKEENLMISKKEAKEAKHVSRDKNVQIHRRALAK